VDLPILTVGDAYRRDHFTRCQHLIIPDWIWKDMRGSLNLRVVEMLRLETETSYGLRSSTRVTNCFFKKKLRQVQANDDPA